MKFSRLLLVSLFLSGAQQASAHEMWIESKAQGSVGAAQEVNVFFGEYSWGKPTPTAKWFSDIADCKLMLTAPDGKTQLLEKNKEEFFTKQYLRQRSKVFIKLAWCMW